jgi:hypothetical protein
MGPSKQKLYNDSSRKKTKEGRNKEIFFQITLFIVVFDEIVIIVKHLKDQSLKKQGKKVLTFTFGHCITIEY